MVRFDKRGFMGEATAFDVILGIMVGSIVSQAITGNAPLVPALAATATLIALHSVLTAVACRWYGLGEMIKGRAPTRQRPRGHSARRIAELTNRDLEDDLRRHGMTSSSYPSSRWLPISPIGPVWRGKLEFTSPLVCVPLRRPRQNPSPPLQAGTLL
jgi:hypothetical protein